MPENTLPYKSEAVTEETRTKAQDWLQCFQDEIQRTGCYWTAPWSCENPYEDEILYQWDMFQLHSHRWLHIYVDKDEIAYLRAKNKDPHCEMYDGSAEDMEVCRLLWHWFTDGKVNV